MSKPLIIKCNRMFPDNIIEAYRQDIMKQMREDGVVVLPPGFELAEVNVDLLEQIRAEIESEYWEDFDSNTVIADNQIDKIFDKHISELKGENK